MNELATQAQDPLSAILADSKQLKEIPIDTVERLFALKLKYDDRQAEREFNVAFNVAQSELLPVAKKGWNPHTKSFFARAEHVQAMLDPIIHKHGFSYSVSGEDSEKEGYFKFKLTLRHVGGHSAKYFMEAANDAVGPKGGGSKSEMQGITSSYSYAKRHLSCNVWGVQLIDDNDGNDIVEPVSTDQTTHLNDLMNEVLTGAQKGQLLNVLKIDDISQLPATKYEYAVGLIERKQLVYGHERTGNPLINRASKGLDIAL